jgi:hypothetical protein
MKLAVRGSGLLRTDANLRQVRIVLSGMGLSVAIDLLGGVQGRPGEHHSSTTPEKRREPAECCA